MDHSILVFFFTAISIFLRLSNCEMLLDTISVHQTIKDGETIVSHGKMYELGFFSPGKSKNRYLGIWYKKTSTGTVVWVANREKPITDTSAMFKVSRNGNLVILTGGNTVIWSSNITESELVVHNYNPVAQLLDTGNLVVWDKNSSASNLLWQSFDYPGDTLLPGMKFGKDLVTGLQRYMTSWKSPDDPSRGLYSNILDTNGYPQPLGWQGQVLISRLGPWNGLGFSGFPHEKLNHIYYSEFVINDKEWYYKYELKISVAQRRVLTWDGKTLILQWYERIKDWMEYGDLKVDSCFMESVASASIHLVLVCKVLNQEILKSGTKLIGQAGVNAKSL